MPSFNRKTLLTLLLIILLTVVVTLLPGTIETELKNLLEPHFGTYYVFWIIGIVILACVLLAVLTHDFGKKQEQKPLTLTPEESQKNYATIRSNLLKRYTKRLEQKMAGRMPFHLRLAQSIEGTSLETVRHYITYQEGELGSKLVEKFKEADGKLLLIGMPGAGKTSLMLEMAVAMLTEEDPHYDPKSLPVLLNLATWLKSFASLEDWIKEVLAPSMGMGLPKPLITEILDSDRLVLLLDGFDEMPEEHRFSCLEALKAYGGQVGKRYVISTRKKEYINTSNDARVSNQIEVLPLEYNELVEQLENANQSKYPEAPYLLEAIKSDDLLGKAADNPFYLNCVQFLFAPGRKLVDFGFKGTTEEERQAEITERFVEQAMAQPSKHGSPEQVRRWLAFLASRMTQRNKVVFELVDLQYDWWRWERKHMAVYGLVFGLQIGLFVGVFAGIFFGILHQTYLAAISYYLLMLITLMLTSMVAFLISGNNETMGYSTSEQLKFKISYKIAKENWKIALLPGIFLGVFIGLFFGVYAGVIGGICIFLLDMVKVKDNQFLQIMTPYHRLKKSLQYGDISILQHFILRWQLYRAGALPRRLVHFLDEMTARHLLETDGATWRFRHRILQEYFAGQWRENEPKNQ